MEKLNARGFSLMETVNAALILALMGTSLAAFRMVMARATADLEDKSFAAGKALAMFNEMEERAGQDRRRGIETLDRYDDTVPFNPVLTTDKAVDRPGGDPAGPLSGNRLTNGHWRYLRHVQVNPVRGNRYARQVVIRIWRYASDSRPEVPGVLLATMAGIIGS